MKGANFLERIDKVATPPVEFNTEHTENGRALRSANSSEAGVYVFYRTSKEAQFRRYRKKNAVVTWLGWGW